MKRPVPRKFVNRRTLLMLLLLLVAGAIVNVAVAWGLARFVHANSTNPRLQGWKLREACRQSVVPWDDATHWHPREFARPGSVLVVVTMVASPTLTDLDFDSLLPPVRAIDEGISRFESLPPPAKAAPGYFYWEGRGWPCIALAAHWSWFDDEWPSPPISGGFDVSHATSARPWPYAVHELRAIPLAPIWPGFAINTLFYAAILWLLFAAPFALRRRSRIKRGLCPACAYPVGATEVCTECGKPVIMHTRISRKQKWHEAAAAFAQR